MIRRWGIALLLLSLLFLPAVAHAEQAPAPKTSILTYIVVSGDTLFEIANFFEVPLKELILLNNIENPDLIEIGQRLVIPYRNNFYIVRPGDTLGEIATYFSADLKDIATLNGIEDPDVIEVGQVVYIPLAEMFYIVEDGDTLGEIAAWFGTGVDKLVEINSIKNPDLIDIKQRIVLPLDAEISTVFSSGCRVFRARVSAYSSSPDETDDTPFITYSGTFVHYGTVAAPWRFPIGTSVFIPNYGWGVVEDRGGLIDGQNFDVWMPSKWEAFEWGVKYLNITICIS